MPGPRLASVILGSFAANVLAETETVEDAFNKFIDQYGRVYSSDEEREQRFEIFKAHYAYIQEENAKGHKYELGINAFADQSPEEFGSKRFGLSSNGPLFKGAYLGKHVFRGVEVPSDVDWVTSGAVTPVKDQKDCGSCWAFSTTGSLEGAWQLASGQLAELSEQQLVDCSHGNNDGCDGGDMDDAFDFLEDKDACSEQSYPYKATQSTCNSASCDVVIPAGGVTGYRDVDVGNEGALKEAVAQQPVSVAIEADQLSFQLYNKGVLTAKCGSQLDHGVLCVGYGTADDGTDYWKVKNSWGASWGENGYVRIERGPGHGENGQCGILAMSSYPVVDASGPAPAPTPTPTPPPAPTPPPTPPAPASGHYGHPPCAPDEIEARIDKGAGLLCAAPCDANGGCPTDTPPHTYATPQCALAAGNGEEYCGLVCAFDFSCPRGAQCYMSDDFLGVCAFPRKASDDVMTLSLKSKSVVV